MFHLSILVMGLCTLLTLMVALFQATRLIVPETTSSRLDTAGKTQAEHILL
jgi:hypothetical protein